MNSDKLLYNYTKKGYLLNIYTKFDGGYYTKYPHIPNGNQIIIIKDWQEKRNHLAVQYFPFVTPDNVYVIL